MRHPSRWSQVLAVVGLATLVAFVGARAQSSLSSLSFSGPYKVSQNSYDPSCFNTTCFNAATASQMGVGADGSGNNYVYVVWEWEDDAASVAKSIRFSRSTDGGATFSNIAISTPTGAGWPFNARLAVEPGGAIDVVWLDYPVDGSSWRYDVFFARSTDFGLTFSDPLNLSNDAIGDNANPQIGVDTSGRIHVVWENYPGNSSTFGIFYRQWQPSDAGSSFSPARNLVTSGLPSVSPELAVAGNNVYVTWAEADSPLLSHISFSRSTDGGANFSTQSITNPANAFGAKLAVDGSGNPYLAWLDNPGGNYDLMFSRSIDNGANFSPAINVSNNPNNPNPNPGDAGDAQIATDTAGNAFLVWRENTPQDRSNNDIYFARSAVNPDGTLSFSTPVHVSDNVGNSTVPSLSLSSVGNINVINVGWADTTDRVDPTTTGPSQIWFAQSTDSGVTFSAQNLSNDGGSSQDVRVLSDKDGNINAVWSDNASGVSQILFSRHSAAQKTNQPPVANAGADQNLHATGPTTSVTLNGSLSSDPDGDALTFVWTEGGMEVGRGAVPTLDLTRAAHTFTLTVTDSGNLSASDDIQVTIYDEPPVANAGPDQTLTAAGATTPVTLSGSATDPDDDPAALTFSWTEGGVPAGSGAVLHLNLPVGTHTFTLTVADPAGLSSSAFTHVTITKPNQPPVAKVGPDQNISCAPRTGAIVTLDGSQSSDPDGDTLGYLWTDESNRIVGTSAKVQVTVAAGMHAYMLTVADPGGLSDHATTHVTVSFANAPTLDVSVSPNVLWPPNHKMVQVTASLNVGTSACDANPAVKLVSVTRSDGNAGDNVQAVDGGPVPFGTDVRSFLVRSENSDTGGDLVYTIVYSVTDNLGNCTKASAQVRVSKNAVSSAGLKPGNNKGK